MPLVQLLFAGLLVLSPAEAQPPLRPALGGEWTLNREQSTAPGPGGPDAADRMPPQGGRGGMRGGGYGGGMGGATRGERPDREEMERRRSLMREVLEAPRRFLITVEDPLVIFTFPDGRVVRYRADGKDEKHQLTSGTVKTRAKWEADRLEIETDLGSGVKITHTYKVTPQRQLVVTTLLPRQSKDLPPMTHTYDELAP